MHILTPAEALSVAILCGGESTRIRKYLGSLPKPMVKFLGVPLLMMMVIHLIIKGVRDILLMNGESRYIAWTFDRPVFQRFGVRVIPDAVLPKGLATSSVYVEETLLNIPQSGLRGTAGATELALRHAKSDVVLVINGDTALDLDVWSVLKEFLNSGAPIGFILTGLSGVPHEGAVEVDRLTKRVVAIKERDQFVGPRSGGTEHVRFVSSTGATLWRRTHMEAFLSALQPGVDLWADALPILAERGWVTGLILPDGLFLDIGTPERLAQAKQHQQQIVAAYMH